MGKVEHENGFEGINMEAGSWLGFSCDSFNKR